MVNHSIDKDWASCDPDNILSKELSDVVSKIVNKLLDQGFNETTIYAFLHKTVDIAKYEALVDHEL